MQIIQNLNCDKVYGYESCEITAELCKQYYTDYLPLSLWDNFELRRNTSVSEQGAELVRLVNPEYHCQSVALSENTFMSDFHLERLPNKSVFILPVASYKDKSWGYDNYMALAEKLKAHQYHPVFLMGPAEKEDSEMIRKSGFSVKENLNSA